ncbi:TPA: DUF4158 domain-containing protein [Salmonella enterica subsp. enterica serovar Chailey]
MPADFLNADQRACYGQFSGEPNDVQLARFFLLDEADMEFINNRRGRANRFAVALLIGCIQCESRRVSSTAYIVFSIIERYRGT